MVKWHKTRNPGHDIEKSWWAKIKEGTRELDLYIDKENDGSFTVYEFEFRNGAPGKDDATAAGSFKSAKSEAHEMLRKWRARAR